MLDPVQPWEFENDLIEMDEKFLLHRETGDITILNYIQSHHETYRDSLESLYKWRK